MVDIYEASPDRTSPHLLMWQVSMDVMKPWIAKCRHRGGAWMPQGDDEW